MCVCEVGGGGEEGGVGEFRVRFPPTDLTHVHQGTRSIRHLTIGVNGGVNGGPVMNCCLLTAGSTS